MNRQQIIHDIKYLDASDWGPLEFAYLNIKDEEDRMDRVWEEWAANADVSYIPILLDLLYNPPRQDEIEMDDESFRIAVAGRIGMIATRIPNEVIPIICPLVNDRVIRDAIILAFMSTEGYNYLSCLDKIINNISALNEKEQATLVSAIKNTEDPKCMQILNHIEQLVPKERERVHKAILESYEIIKKYHKH